MNWNTVKKVLKWAGIGLGGLLGVIVIAMVVLYFLGGLRVNKIHDIQVAAITVPSDEASIERGRHVIETRGLCQECHGDNLEGEVLEDDPIFGRFAPPNLTSGEGGLGNLSDIDYVRAIRHGVKSDGRAIFFMPSEIYNKIGDEDLGAAIAYLKSLPPIDNDIPESRARLGLRVLAVLDEAAVYSTTQIDHDAPRPPTPEPGITGQYGEYLANICTLCHGDGLGGGVLPDDQSVRAPNLTPGGTLGAWSEADFINTLRDGVTPGGNELDEENMPWKYFREMTDDELKAIWLYLSSLPPAPPKNQ